MNNIKVSFSADSNYHTEVFQLSEQTLNLSFNEIDKVVRKKLLITYDNVSAELSIKFFKIHTI